MSHQLLDIESLHALAQRPELFAPGEPLFWNDPHISKGMLEAHLNPDTEAASRQPETIDAIVAWLTGHLQLAPGAAWLDIGCGPGLYTSRLVTHDLRVTGLDYSERSIAYARDYAAEHDLPITYRYQDYLTLDDGPEYDVISLIYGDFNPLSPEKRDSLLRRVHHALKPGGRFVFDVTTPVLRQKYGTRTNWYLQPEGGFWAAEPHLVIEQGFSYESNIWVDQMIIVKEDGTHKVYHNWFHDHTLDTIVPVVEAQGFAVRAHWNDLAGTPYAPGGAWIGLVAEKV